MQEVSCYGLNERAPVFNYGEKLLETPQNVAFLERNLTEAPNLHKQKNRSQAPSTTGYWKILEWVPTTRRMHTNSATPTSALKTHWGGTSTPSLFTNTLAVATLQAIELQQTTLARQRKVWWRFVQCSAHDKEVASDDCTWARPPPELEICELRVFHHHRKKSLYLVLYCYSRGPVPPRRLTRSYITPAVPH